MKRTLRRWLENFQVAKDHLSWRVTDLFYIVGGWFRWLWRSFWAWWYFRKGRYLLEGVPAVLAAAGALTLAVMVMLHSRDSMIIHYFNHAKQASDQRNFSAARIALERLALLDRARPDFRFALARVELAQCQENLNQARAEFAHSQDVRGKALLDLAQRHENRGWALIDSLAPSNEQKHGPAHLAEAQRWWSSRPRTPAKVQMAEIQLRRALQAQPADADAHALLGELCRATGRLADAEAHLAEAVKLRPAAELTLAQVCKARGNLDAANAHAQKAEAYFRQLTQANLDNHAARINWADAALFLGKPDRAVEVLNSGLTLTNAPQYQVALSVAYVIWADKLARDGKGGLPERLALLEQALRYNPGNLEVLQRLLVLGKLQDATIDRNWAALRTQGDQLAPLQLGLQHAWGNLAGCGLLLAVNWAKDIEADKARSTLRTMLAQGKSPAMIHVVLGMDAQQRGKIEEAREHYEQAYQLAPSMPGVVNNMAWTLANGDSPDFQKALQMIDTALDRSPNQPNFRDTRGQILAKMGRWKEAVVDLEAALTSMPRNPALHLRLVEAYGKLGQPEMAAEHQRLADKLPSRE